MQSCVRSGSFRCSGLEVLCLVLTLVLVEWGYYVLFRRSRFCGFYWGGYLFIFFWAFSGVALVVGWFFFGVVAVVGGFVFCLGFVVLLGGFCGCFLGWCFVLCVCVGFWVLLGWGFLFVWGGF